MKKNYFFTMIGLIGLQFLSAQTVTVDDPTPNASATYTFTYTTNFDIGTGTSTPNVFYMTLPSGYPSISPTVADGNLLDPYVTFKVDGVSYPCSTSFGTIGGAWASGIQLSVASATTGVSISSGSVIEVIVSGLITNPANSSSYTFNWKSAASSGAATENFSYVLDFSSLSQFGVSLEEKNTKVFPNPSKDFIQILGLNETVGYEILGMDGRVIYVGKMGNEDRIYIEELTNGVYFLKFENGNMVSFLKN